MPFILLVGAAPNAIAYNSKQFTSGEFFKFGLMKNLIEGGFDGSVLPINPGHLKIRGLAAYRILLDLTMPENTGTGRYRKLHNKKEYREIPVIAISGLAGSYLAVSRSVPVIAKPPDEELVLWEVAKALGAPL